MDPMARHGVARDLTFEAFLATSVQHPVFHHFWVAKMHQKQGVSEGDPLFRGCKRMKHKHKPIQMQRFTVKLTQAKLGEDVGALRLKMIVA